MSVLDIAIAGAYLFPMYLVGHWYTQTIFRLSLGLADVITLRFTRYNHLPQS